MSIMIGLVDEVVEKPDSSAEDKEDSHDEGECQNAYLNKCTHNASAGDGCGWLALLEPISRINNHISSMVLLC